MPFALNCPTRPLNPPFGRYLDSLNANDFSGCVWWRIFAHIGSSYFHPFFLFFPEKKKNENIKKKPQDTRRDNCYCRSHHLHVSPCPTPRTSALNNCPCPDAVSLPHNPLNPRTLTCFNKVHEASSSGRFNSNSLLLNS